MTKYNKTYKMIYIGIMQKKIALLPSVTKATGHWNLRYMQERPTQKVLFIFPEIKAYYVLIRPGWRKTLISLPYI